MLLKHCLAFLGLVWYCACRILLCRAGCTQPEELWTCIKHVQTKPKFGGQVFL